MSLVLAVAAIAIIGCISIVDDGTDATTQDFGTVTYNSIDGFSVHLDGYTGGQIALNYGTTYNGPVDSDGNAICGTNGVPLPLGTVSLRTMYVADGGTRPISIGITNLTIAEVVFDSNNGSDETKSVGYSLDTFVLPDFGWTGQNGESFRGWATSATATEPNVDSKSYTVKDGGATLYAVYGSGEEPEENFTVTFEQPENGSLSVKYDGKEISSGTEVPENAEIIITATAKEGYELESLKVNGADFENGATYTVGADVNIEAKFKEASVGPGPGPEPEEYDVTVKVNDSSRGTASASVSSAEEGDTVTLTCTPNSGYRFVGWKSDDVEITGNSFVMPAKDVTIIAVFEAIPPAEYTITVKSPVTGGTATASATSATAGTVITLTATPDEGYVLDHWEINGEESTRDTFTMPAGEVTVTPVFRLLEVYNVTVEISGDGTVLIGDEEVTDGQVIRIREQVDLMLTYTVGEDSYTVMCDVSDDSARAYSTNGVITVTGITGDCTLTIDFVPGHMITVTDNEHGRITPGTGLQAENTTVTYTITPDSGYAVSRVLVDGQEVEVVGNEFQVAIGTSEHTISVEYVYVGIVDDDDEYVPPVITVIPGDDDDDTTIYIVAVAAGVVVAILAALILMQTRKS